MRQAGPTGFGALLRRLRLAAGLSQEGLAERARISAKAVGALELGLRRAPYRETVEQLLNALDATPEQREQLAALAEQARARGPRSAAPAVGASSLPLALTSFIGRERELEEIAAIVPDHRLVTLTGSGGVGKTQTALRVGTALEEAPGSVCFVSLAAIKDPSFVISAIASALHVKGVPDQPLLQTLLGHLKSKTLLLILDNCEHVIAEAAEVARNLLVSCAGVRILATSREPLKIAGENTYRLPSLAIPAATALFAERAYAIDTQFALSDENAPVVADICRRLDGIPLAIELAAARVKMLSPRQLRDRLDERFRVLADGDRSALPRHQTMRALIDWSHNLLDERERVLFRRLGIFVNGFTLEGAVAVGSGEDLSDSDELDVFDVLASLVDQSLVLAEPKDDAVRYRLLESTRAYAVEKLDEAGERDLLVGRHLRYLRGRFAELRERHERIARRTDLDAALQTELEDVRSALDAALARSEVIDGGDLLANISEGWQTIGLGAEGMARCEAYLAALPTGELRLRALLSTVLSVLLGYSGDKVRAFELSTQAIELAGPSGDASSLARALCSYAVAATFLHQFDDAAGALAQAEAIPGKSASLRSWLLVTRAMFSHLRGDLETAARIFDQLRRERRSLGNARGAQLAALNLAEIEHERGRTQRAIRIARETLSEARAGADNALIALLLHNLAGYLAAVDDLPGAEAAARESIGIYAALEPDHAHLAIAIEHLALVFAVRGDRADAVTLEGYADAEFQRHGYRREFTEATTRDRLTALLRESLAPDEFARRNAEGAALTPEAAIALALQEHELT